MRSEILLPAILLAIGIAPLNAGSLWREAVTDERGMFASKTARRLGDIVRVTLDENFISTITATLKDARTPKTDSKGLASQFVNSLVGFAGSKLERKKFPANFLPQNSPTAPRISPDTSSFDGKGEITRGFTTSAGAISTQVIDVLPNGNLVIEGIRQVGFDKERIFVTLRGIIRPVDVGAVEGALFNSIPSSRVADARLDIVGEGTLNESQKKGWLMKLDDKITPY